jgi:hypothetical protein
MISLTKQKKKKEKNATRIDADLSLGSVVYLHTLPVIAHPKCCQHIFL